MTWVLASINSQQKRALTRERVRTEIGPKLQELGSCYCPEGRKLILVGKIYRAGIYHFERIFPFYDRVMDTDIDAFRPLLARSIYPEDFEDFDAFIQNFLYDKTNRDSVRSAIISAFYNAVILRPELGSRLLQYIELAFKCYCGRGTSCECGRRCI